MSIKMLKSQRILALTSIEVRVLKGPLRVKIPTLKILIHRSMPQSWQRKPHATYKRWRLHMIQIQLMPQKIFMTNLLWQGCSMLKNSTKNHKSVRHTKKLLVGFRKCQSRLGCKRISNSYRQCPKEVSFQDNRKWPRQRHCQEKRKHS